MRALKSMTLCTHPCTHPTGNVWTQWPLWHQWMAHFELKWTGMEAHEVAQVELLISGS